MSGTAQGKLLGAAALPSGTGHCSAPRKGNIVHGFSSGVTVLSASSLGLGPKERKEGPTVSLTTPDILSCPEGLR